MVISYIQSLFRMGPMSYPVRSQEGTLIKGSTIIQGFTVGTNIEGTRGEGRMDGTRGKEGCIM